MVYFLDTMPTIGNKSDIPLDLHMMQHVYRSKTYDKNTKSISNTDTVLTINHHKHDMCIEEISCQKAKVELANSQHYRKDCPTIKYYNEKKCEKFEKNIVMDTTVWRHLDTVIKKTNIALHNIIFD